MSRVDPPAVAAFGLGTASDESKSLCCHRAGLTESHMTARTRVDPRGPFTGRHPINKSEMSPGRRGQPQPEIGIGLDWGPHIDPPS